MITPYRPIKFATIIAYMLQNVEYNPAAYVRWLLRTRNFKRVMYRRSLDTTKAARLFQFVVAVMILVQMLLGLMLWMFGGSMAVYVLWGFVFILASPFTSALFVVVPLVLARILYANPKEKRLIAESKSIFEQTKAVKIAVAGSYGKTSMKEMLGTVLGEAKKVAITPANKNVASSHAHFARSLSGDEDVLIVEFGEGASGDVAAFSATFQPNLVVITGIAPAHLDHYPSVEAAAKDIFSATTAVDSDAVYVNHESTMAQPYILPHFHAYSRSGIGALKVTTIKSDLQGVSFMVNASKESYKITTALLGQHTIGPLCAVIAIAERLGLTPAQIQSGIARVSAYEHRMQPKKLASGAWIIDDTYNGNIEGMQAGLALLKELTAKRKMYVTPGLVDQGDQTKNIHSTLGTLIADCQPDIVVLMKNSVTDYIVSGLTAGGFNKELRIELDPLRFYTHLEEFIADGDIVMMQNDWPDNYA